jgi:hypothetical protein
MSNFILGFLFGAGACYGGIWLSTHPSDRSALFSKIKALFNKKDAP